MICYLQKYDILKDKQARIAQFAEYFVEGLATEVEKGQAATDSDFISFQKSVNANVKSGPVVRHKVLLRKLFEFAPDFLEAADADVAVSADFGAEIFRNAKELREAISKLNDAYAAKHGSDLFKATNKTVSAQSTIGETVESFEGYKKLIENLYFVFWEGPGSKLPDKPTSFKDVNALRTELQHDTDHGKQGAVAKKKTKAGEVFKKYSGSTSPVVVSPERFRLVQLSLLKALKSDVLKLLADEGATN